MNDIQTFMVDLDSIFDTRLATLFLHDQKSAEQSISTIDYYRRKDDSFHNTPFEVFKTLYKDRNIETLKHSIKTPFVSFLLDFVKGTYQNSVNGFEQKKPKILFNIFPYKISEEDLTAIRDVFIGLTSGFSLLEFIDLPIEQITPIFLRDRIGAFSLYNYTDWLEIHAANDNLKKVSIPAVSLFGPKLHFKKVSVEEKNFLLQNKIDPFDQLQKLANPFVNLKLLDIVMYSADLLPKDIPSKEEK
jgi:hypothetical protein